MRTARCSWTSWHRRIRSDRLIKCSYSLLGLISFLTYGKDECRAWTIKKGTKAPQAAGKIHTDIERGFIRAEVIAYDDMIKYGGVNAAKEKGQLRSEGKEYVVDGDMILLPLQRVKSVKYQRSLGMTPGTAVL